MIFHEWVKARYYNILRETGTVELRQLQILDYDEAAMQQYEDLKRMRLKVRKMDLQIAATALRHGGRVVTRNVRDFKKVPGLTLEDWSK